MTKNINNKKIETDFQINFHHIIRLIENNTT